MCLLCIILLFVYPAAAAKKRVNAATLHYDRVALVIGNGKYPSRTLKNPENDALSVKKVLTDLGFEVDYQTNLDQAGMIRIISDFYHHKAKLSSLRLVYYAGHGVQYEGRNYLIPIDADSAITANIPKSSFLLDELRRELDQLNTGASIIVLDTCRISLCPVEPCRGLMSSLALTKERKSSGTLIAYSTGPGRPADDGKNTEHSVYTQVLTELMPTPGLPVEKLFRILTEEVFQRSGGLQKPEFVNGLMGAEICLKSGPLGQCPLNSELKI